ICQIRKKSLSLRKTRISDKAIAAWIEDDRLITGQGKALVIIMNSKGCEWAIGEGGGCSMCGYSNDTSETISAQNLISQVESVLAENSTKDFQVIKLFNSGSFLDDNEIPADAQIRIMEMIAVLPKVKEVIIESRPEFVKKEKINQLLEKLGEEKKLEVGVGLESSNDFIRINLINKGFLFEDFKIAVTVATKNNSRVKSYLLFKPPFISEQEAIIDNVNSIIDSIKAGARSISINPLNIQNGTLVYELWKDDLYRSPWFWSLKEVIQTAWKRINDEGLKQQVDRILCDPSGAGTQRGIHNCKKCDKQFIKATKKYSLTQDPTIFDTISCDCYELWKEITSYESLSRDHSLRSLENAQKVIY
ncbi:MAG: archaeosine biosynthesis radical SAM protein RaSEA, partial [Candidatus Thorarchaeota archaeon]